ncbi:hypothetical protein NMY22_g9297 [Coprinellus aureogranulatus]|nr:hypothetical protein NMY22_g9297 [Coprinellus aureogranulatus]
MQSVFLLHTVTSPLASMRLGLSFVVGLVACIVQCQGALTKGYIQINGPNMEKALNLSTQFSSFEGYVVASDTAPPLLVQLDLEKAQETESDIEVLNGYWVPDLYRYFGIYATNTLFLEWNPPYHPYIGFINVQQTPDANMIQKENAYTAVYPNPTELPYQASAIWRYDPAQGGKLIPMFLGVDGTRMPAIIKGDWYDGGFRFVATAPASTTQPLDFYFTPIVE